MERQEKAREKARIQREKARERERQKASRDAEKARKAAMAAAIREQKAAKAKAITAAKAARARAGREAKARRVAKNRARGRMEEIIRVLDEGEVPGDSVGPDTPGDEDILPTPRPRPRPRPAYRRNEPVHDDAGPQSQVAPPAAPPNPCRQSVHQIISQDEGDVSSSSPTLAPTSSPPPPLRTRRTKQKARNVAEELAEMGPTRKLRRRC